MEKESYQKFVGKLIYLSTTHPDITYDVNLLSQFMHQPKKSHVKAAHRVIRYLKGSMDRGLQSKKCSHMQVWAYSDVDWAGSIDDR